MLTGRDQRREGLRKPQGPGLEAEGLGPQGGDPFYSHFFLSKKEAGGKVRREKAPEVVS